MLTNSQRMEKNTEHVVKSCRNLVQTEIKTLRTDLGNLRGFLRNCQDTINSETTRLETKCLGKIESLEEERNNLEKIIVSMKEENQSLQESSNALLTKLKDTERDLQHSQEESSQLRVHMKSLESQLTTKTSQCKDFCKKLEASKLQCLSLENKLASNEAYVKEQKSILNEMASDNKHLECSTKDLQIRAAESEEYEKALESHIEELEAICSILREQHDEQRKYFLQKESSLKRESQDIQRNLENENKKLTHELDLMTTKLQNESSKSFELQEIKNKQEKYVQSKEEMIIELDDKIDTLKHELQIEKATIEMLNRKNSDLTEEVARLNTQLSVIEEKANSTDQLVNRKALKEIGNTVQQYIDDNSSLAKKLENTLIASNNEKLEECERQLVFERQKRLSAEMDAANLSVELEKAKVEIAVYRNNMSNSTRNRSIQNSKSHVLALPGLAKTSSTSSLNISNPPRELLPTASPEMLRNLPANLSNGTNTLPGITNGVAHEERTLLENDSRSTTSDINNAVSLAEISISDRASRKMEEARRKAMEMLNKSSPSL